jgi:hypothetical protein
VSIGYALVPFVLVPFVLWHVPEQINDFWSIFAGMSLEAGRRPKMPAY